MREGSTVKRAVVEVLQIADSRLKGEEVKAKKVTASACHMLVPISQLLLVKQRLPN